MNYKPEVCASSDGKFSQNALCFATEAEALTSAKDLYSRWMLCTDYRAVESSDAVNYAIVDGKMVAV